MREFGRIETTIWQNRKFRSLSDDGRALWIYTLCCPHGNSVGCFVLPDGYIVADLNWSSERVSQTVSELLGKGLIVRDEDTSLTWVRGWWGHNTIENPNVAKGAMKAILALPRGPVFSQFLADFERFPKPLAELLRKQFPNGYTNPIETKEPEPEPEREPEPENIQTSSGADAPGPSLFPESTSPDTEHGGKPEAAAGGESAEELFWGLQPQAEARKVTRSLMGKLLQALGDPDRAYDALRKALESKDARHYIGGVIRREGERRQAEGAAANGHDTREPAFVQAARREGARVDVRDDLDAAGGAWEINGIVFDGQGNEIGF